MDSDTTVLEIEDGYLMEAPLLGNGKWMAKIEPDDTKPGGIYRHWAERAYDGDRCYEVMNWLKPGCVVEFGEKATRNKSDTRKHKWYGVCVSITPVSVAFKEFPMARGAFAWADSHYLGGKND